VLRNETEAHWQQEGDAVTTGMKEYGVDLTGLKG
jgi:hypothetical protein